jgi:deoxyadenosine/deoxycytidine kinase
MKLIFQKNVKKFYYQDQILSIFTSEGIINYKITLMHIAIAGNIGSGKTTLTSLLAKHFKWEPHYEDVVDNPYLDDFYHQMERWSFNLQIYFLNSRFRQVIQHPKRKESHSRPNDYEDAHIFAPNLYSMGLMTNRDFQNYSSLLN